MRPSAGLPEDPRQRYGKAVLNALRPLALMAALALVACTASRADSPAHALQELRRFNAAEARQGVAVDAHHFYAIGNREIGKYDKHTGERVGHHVAPKGGGIHHLNSGIVFDGRLYCANSNYPGVPMLSSIEIFDTETLEHVESHSFGSLPGSATWVDRREGLWWVGFGNYEGQGGIPGRGTAWTHVALYDDEWRRVGGYGFPAEAVKRFGTRSNSGSAFGPGGLLYATGHNEPELYVLRVPKTGAALEFLDVLSVTAEGQGIAWDPSDPRVLYTIVRSAREVVVSRMPD
ncbi:MAG: hypothetical protein JRD03_08740 [Deltaproteobacteria bacterium]|nr:hypothetical protein [Deltaproteobacteria bacterium]